MSVVASIPLWIGAGFMALCGPECEVSSRIAVRLFPKPVIFALLCGALVGFGIVAWTIWVTIRDGNRHECTGTFILGAIATGVVCLALSSVLAVLAIRVAS